MNIEGRIKGNVYHIGPLDQERSRTAAKDPEWGFVERNPPYPIKDVSV